MDKLFPSTMIGISQKQRLKHITVQCKGIAQEADNTTKPLGRNLHVSRSKADGIIDNKNDDNSSEPVEANLDNSLQKSDGNNEGQRSLSFGRLQPTRDECKSKYRRAFGKFVAREAILDEEFWTAAWMRAESHYEAQPYDRFVDSHKRKFAEQEFNALKRRCFGRDGHSLKCFCIVAVKREEKSSRRTVLNSVVGTLDLSIRQLLHGETFPGEHVKGCVYLSNKSGHSRYGYVANVCVAKYARRQGIASNMLHLAIEIAGLSGVKDVYVHVNTDNKGAQQLYRNIGFKRVEEATSFLLKERKELLFLSVHS